MRVHPHTGKYLAIAGGLNLIFKATRELAPWRQEPVVHHVHDRVHDLMTAP